MEETILISYLNDFIYCPVSIYFHKLYGKTNTLLYHRDEQLNGIKAHESVDNNNYSSKKDIFQGIEIYSEKYNLIGKIDIFDNTNGILTERKNYIKTVYDGYIFQLYAQYFCLTEMGYKVNTIRLYSMKDNKIYNIDLPCNNNNLFNKFENLIINIREFDMHIFKQTNKLKCKNCIYEPSCDRSLLC